MSRTDGGPAFPVGCKQDWMEGMSLRDYFAGMALKGKLSNPAFTQDIEVYRKIPMRCYEIADAMLKEREE